MSPDLTKMTLLKLEVRITKKTIMEFHQITEVLFEFFSHLWYMPLSQATLKKLRKFLKKIPRP